MSNKSKFKRFSIGGIWTPYYEDANSTAPFVCIEPWYGLADNINSNKIYKEKNILIN